MEEHGYARAGTSYGGDGGQATSEYDMLMHFAGSQAGGDDGGHATVSRKPKSKGTVTEVCTWLQIFSTLHHFMQHCTRARHNIRHEQSLIPGNGIANR